MHAFTPNHYVPVLFTKAGERDALGAITPSRKASFTPLFVVHPIGWDFDKDAPEHSIDQHLAKLPSALATSWGTRSAFLDAAHVDEHVMADGRHPLEWLIAETAKLSLELVPVISPSHSPDYRRAVRRLVATGSTEVCLRLEVVDWPVLPLPSGIDELMSSIGVRPADVHLVLDLRGQTGSAASAAVTGTLNRLAHSADWKTLTVAATAMPATVPPGRGVHVIPREEWASYASMVSEGSFGSRRPTFGDYAISHPDPFADIDPRVLQISAKLKYTAERDWLIGRGGLFKGNAGRSGGGQEIRAVARELVARTEFTTRHCGADEWIVAASGTGATGAPRTWVKVGTWHHIERVLDQIALM